MAKKIAHLVLNSNHSLLYNVHVYILSFS